jgi:putative phosphoribosyl transferase
MIFKDRVDAGERLAWALRGYKGQDVVVYALPRGGVVVGAEVAHALNAPFDLIIVRKIGHPLSPEYAVAAVAEDGHTVMNPQEVKSIDKRWFEVAAQMELKEARRRRKLYTPSRDDAGATDKVAIIVDDGLATGLTMFAAVQEVRHCNPRKIVVAVPIAPPQTIEALNQVADEVLALDVTSDFSALGSFYLDFRPVTDGEVIELMKSAPVKALPVRN